MKNRYAFLAAVVVGFVPAAQAQVLTLDEAVRLGEVQSPRLAAQRHALGASEEQIGRAGELPDPKLRVGIENLPVTGADRLRYDRDFMTSRAIGFMQEFPDAQKRSARSSRAARARDVERAMLYSQQAVIRRDAALAWLEAYFAERNLAALRRLVERTEAQAGTVPAGVARGRQTAAEGFMLKGAAEQARDRIIDQERVVERARHALAFLIGADARRPVGDAPDLRKLAHPREALLARLQEHPQLRVFDQREELARAEVDLARASKRSDWSLEVAYGQRRPAFDNMLTVMVAIDLPWQTESRQDRDVAAKLSELEQARSLREEARRMQETEVRGLLADYDAAGRRIEHYRATILPLAQDRVQAALAAYRGGRGELASVLEAHRAATEAELSLVGVELEQGRAWANLNFLYPHEAAR